ncbi:CvpA family protein [bacterium]|nr:CvpA family protein [bacterium]
MNWLDITFLVIIGINGLLGLWRGLIREVFTLLGIVGGVLIASRTYELTLPFVERFIANPNLAKIVSFILIFLIAAILIHILGVAISKLFKTLFLGWLDRIFGLLFGLVKGVAIVLIVILLLSKFPLGNSEKLLESSIVVPYAFILLEFFLPLLPEDFSGILQKLLPQEPLPQELNEI